METKKCVFCGRSNLEVDKIFASKLKDISICSSCISKLNQHKHFDYNCNLSSKLIHEQIKESVIGQDHVLKSFASVLYKYLLCTQLKMSKVKTNVMLIGATGTGKTYLLEVVSQLFKIPFLTVDCTSLTATGYVGDDIESAISRYIRKAGGVEKAKNGIIYLDEIDKISNSDKSLLNNASISKDAVQQELLRIVEGSTIEINIDNKRPHMSQVVQFDTSNVLFVAGGAFTGIDKTIKSTYTTQNNNTLLGNHAKISMPENKIKVIVNALAKYGMLKELLARFPTILQLKNLEYDHYMEILKHRNSKLQSYIEVLKYQNIYIQITDCAYNKIVEISMGIEIGARGIICVVDTIFHVLMYDYSLHTDENNTILINESMVIMIIDKASQSISLPI